MTPQELATKFVSASTTCRNGKCPFTTQCRGTTETCKMKEVAMIIRGVVEENETLRARNALLEALTKPLIPYINDLERINEHYYQTIKSFQDGYRPKTKRKKLKPRKPPVKEDPKEMDGDERYAQQPPKKKPDLPVVMI